MANEYIEGLDKLLAKMEQMGDKGDKSINKILKESAKILQSEMEKQAPPISKSTKIHIKTNIKVSNVTNQGTGKYIRVGPGKETFWDLFCEYGTTKNKAQPFVAVSYLRTKNKIEKYIKSEFTKVIGT